MAKENKNTIQKTAAQHVIGVLKRRGAYSEQTAISIEQFKNLPLTSGVIAYTIANLMQDEIVIRTDEGNYYFSQENYHKLEKIIHQGYKMIIAVPLIVILLIFFIKDYDIIKNFIQGFMK